MVFPHVKPWMLCLLGLSACNSPVMRELRTGLGARLDSLRPTNGKKLTGLSRLRLAMEEIPSQFLVREREGERATAYSWRREMERFQKAIRPGDWLPDLLRSGEGPPGGAEAAWHPGSLLHPKSRSRRLFESVARLWIREQTRGTLRAGTGLKIRP